MGVEYLEPDQPEYIAQCKQIVARAESGECIGAVILEWASD